MSKDIPTWLDRSLLSFTELRGAELHKRTHGFTKWISQRRGSSGWPFSRVHHDHPGPLASVSDESGNDLKQCINFGSQDYLSLSRHPAVVESARQACEKYGVHSAGSSIVAGRMDVTLRLEHRLAEILGKTGCCVFPTGWSAGFGVLAGLVRKRDTIVLDELAHNCLAEGATHATKNLVRFRHNDLDRLEYALKTTRDRDASNGLFVVIESLYSMESDWPDIREVVRLSRNYDAVTIVDVAHDFGVNGGGLKGVPVSEYPDVIMGSFSKTFASNGGFVAACQAVVDYLRCYSPSFTFSNALSGSVLRLCCSQTPPPQEGR